MKHHKIITIALLILLSGTTFAQQAEKKTRQDFKHSINTCPFGVAFGIFSVNYQYLLQQKHGLVFRVDYEAAPGEYSDAKIEGYGTALILNYRYHFKKEMNSCYAGAFSRARVYKGSGNLNDGAFDFNLPELTLGANVGRRWVWNNGLNINFLLGYGYTFKQRNISPYSDEINERVEGFEKKYNFMNSFLGEMSVGYAF